MSQPGWIKLHRGIADHWLWDCEFSYAQAWIDLLLKACYKPNKLMIKGQLVELKRGQQARSEVTLSREWKWSRGKVRRFINQCEKDGMIECKATHLTSIITICNYDSFQGSDTADGTPNATPGGTTNGQQTVHKQEGNNSRSEEPIGDFQSPGDVEVASSKQKTKGSRIADEWEMPSDWIEWAVVEMSVFRNVAVSESGRFKDYWMSQPGAKGVKANWKATWRNWVRSAAERNPQIVKKSSSPREFGA